MQSVELGTQADRDPHATAIVVRRIDHARPADQAVVVQLLREHLAAMHRSLDAEGRYRWLYRDNPHGPSVTYLASDARTGAPAGITSLFPRRVLVAGHARTGSIGGDGYVRPPFRRRGIAKRLHQTALAEMSPADVGFMYGPPEPYNLRALLGAGSVVVGSVQRYIRVLSLACLASRSGPRGAVLRAMSRLLLQPTRTSLHLEALGGEPDPRVDEVFALAADSAPVLPVLDATFCAWRFGRCPSRAERPFLVLDGGKPVAVAAIERKGGRAGLVALLCPRPLLVPTLRGLLGACRDDDAVEIQIHVPSAALQRAILRLGFLPRERKAFQVQVTPDHPDRATLVRDDGWSYQWGDGDVDEVL